MARFARFHRQRTRLVGRGLIFPLRQAAPGIEARDGRQRGFRFADTVQNERRPTPSRFLQGRCQRADLRALGFRLGLQLIEKNVHRVLQRRRGIFRRVRRQQSAGARKAQRTRHARCRGPHESEQLHRIEQGTRGLNFQATCHEQRMRHDHIARTEQAARGFEVHARRCAMRVGDHRTFGRRDKRRKIKAGAQFVRHLCSIGRTR